MTSRRAEKRRSERRERLRSSGNKHQLSKKQNLGQFKSKWTSQQCAMVGFLCGRGETSVSIARKLGLNDASIRRMTSQWDLPKAADPHGDRVTVPVILGKSLRSAISSKAEEKGIQTDELVEMIMSVLVKDDLWGAVLDD